MPLYDFECSCGCIKEFIAAIDEIKKCPACGCKMKRLIPSSFSINMGVGPYGYYDDDLQTYVHTNKHRRQVMKEQGVSEINKKNTRVSDKGKWV